ncbi:transposase [Kordiimonas pumila]|uniref:Transposase n=1 Tax=Kordiimonas pumila TaxID=2161677 RepID=A0ABV7D6S9_9PROT|nr:transposase [Kordiimonas pumila]
MKAKSTKSASSKAVAEQTVKNIRIVLESLRGEGSIAELCRREGLAQSMYYKWPKEFLEAGKPVDLSPPKVKEGELELWLVDLVCPFATKDRLVEACLHDLITGPLKGMTLHMQKTDPKTGEKSIIKLGGEK